MNNKIWRLSTGNPKFRFTVVCTDFVIVNLILMLTVLFGHGMEAPFFEQATKITFAIFNLVFIVVQSWNPPIIDRRLVSAREVAWNVFRLVFVHCFAVAIILRLLSNDGRLFTNMSIFFASEYLLILLSRFVEYHILGWYRIHGRNVRRIIFVGHDPVLIRLYDKMMANPMGGYHVLGYFSDVRMEKEPEGLSWLGDVATLNRKLTAWNKNVMEEPNIDGVYCSMSHNNAQEIELIMHACDRNIMQFFYVPRIFASERMRLKPVMLDDYMCYSNRIQPLLDPENRIIKRTFDVVFSGVVCLFLIPLTVIVGLIIKIQSPGPVFFKQLRTGFDGRNFYCYKFRSMHVNKDADTAQATEHDPRKFPFGDFMRRANIDELPQFFNVLKGDMSIVGPRPHMLHHTEMYGKLIDDYMVRLFCKPGVTGLAQVTGFRGETKELWQMEGRVKCDIYYVEHWSFWLDLKIIAMTFISIFKHDKNAF